MLSDVSRMDFFIWIWIHSSRHMALGISSNFVDAYSRMWQDVSHLRATMCRTLVVSFHTWALLTWKYMLVCWKCCSVFHWLLSCFYFFFVCLSLENSNNGSNCMSINHFCLWDQWKPKICNEVWCSVYITVAPSGESVLPKVSVFVHQIFTTTEAAVLQTGQWPAEVWVDQS